MTFQHTWLPFIYLYGVGGLIFAFGMTLIYKMKTIDLQKKRDRYWNKIMYAGLFYFMIIHAVMIMLAGK